MHPRDQDMCLSVTLQFSNSTPSYSLLLETGEEKYRTETQVISFWLKIIDSYTYKYVIVLIKSLKLTDYIIV